jgi:glycyl-tRNA synthetase beta chain
VLTTVMRSHQKYFSLLDAKGNLAPHFLITSNTQTADNGKAIIAGNERVLRARFSDARFFWDQDRKKPLNDWAHGLETVTFHAKLGTVADKVKRIKALAVALADYVPAADKAQAARAADLCKADLVTGMVGEFAELQGIMGRYYALQQQETPAIADAIRDHYKPQGPGDSTPTQPVSICVAPSEKNPPAAKTLMHCAARHWAVSASYWKMACASRLTPCLHHCRRMTSPCIRPVIS